MRARRVTCIVSSMIAVSALGICFAVEERNVPRKMELRILYVGHAGSAREKDFVDFLGKYFKEVEKGDLAKFRNGQADGFDVVILDYDGDGFKAPRLRLSPGYTRPTITVGVVGAFICDNSRLKTGYI